MSAPRVDQCLGAAAHVVAGASTSQSAQSARALVARALHRLPRAHPAQRVVLDPSAPSDARTVEALGAEIYADRFEVETRCNWADACAVIEARRRRASAVRCGLVLLVLQLPKEGVHAEAALHWLETLLSQPDAAVILVAPQPWRAATCTVVASIDAAPISALRQEEGELALVNPHDYLTAYALRSDMTLRRLRRAARGDQRDEVCSDPGLP